MACNRVNIPPQPEQEKDFTVGWVKWLRKLMDATKELQNCSVDTTDDIIIDNSNSGIVLKSPDGHYWRVQVTNAGALTQTDLGTTKP